VLPIDTEAEWLTARRTGIGGSDAAAVLGLSRYRTPLQVYYEKIGEAPAQIENTAMKMGKLLEPVVLQLYADESGREVRRIPGLIQSTDYPFMVASLDGYTQDSRVVEAKTSGHGADWGDDGTDEIPTEYILQVQHYMAMTGFEVADVAVLISGRDFRMYEVPADPELHDMMRQRFAEFWARVERQEPPEPTCQADILRYCKAQEGHVIATSEALEALSMLRKVREDIQALESRKDELQSAIMACLAMGGGDTLTDCQGKALVTWKTTKPRTTFDTKTFQAEHPDLYAKYLREGEPGRRFLVK